MTEDEKLDILRTMVGGADSDEVLSTYLKIAGSKILAKAFPYKSDVTEVPEKYSYLQCEIAAFILNKRGAEGETSHTENGITRVYENANIPNSLMRQITPYVGTIF